MVINKSQVFVKIYIDSNTGIIKRLNKDGSRGSIYMEWNLNKNERVSQMWFVKMVY